jgi:trk system potassium uptake protein TrkA
MIVVIIGAGVIGGSIAEFLVGVGRDVIVIDRDKEALQGLASFLDIQTIQGHGCDPNVLTNARVSQAELVLAMTPNEEVNLLAATCAKRLGAQKTVARARSPHYLKPNGFDYRQALDVDLLISPEVLTAAEVVKYLDNPDALALEFYAHGKVQLLQFELEPDHRFCDHFVRELGLPGGVLAVLVTRGEEVLIPKGDLRLMAGDKVTLLGKRGTLEGMRHITGRGRAKIETVVIAGGGETGAVLADTLEQKVRSVKLIELNIDRCRMLSSRLNRTTVLHGDATHRHLLVEERVGAADIFVSAMKSDEDNIMAALLAKKLGAGKCVAIVKRADYTPVLLENTAIDLALSPRQVAANKILALVKRGLIKNISLLEEGRAEVIEFTPRPDSPLLNTSLKEAIFPAGCLVAMIGSGHSVRIPRGDDQIRPGETVIMVTLAEVADKVEMLF